MNIYFIYSIDFIYLIYFIFQASARIHNISKINIYFIYFMFKTSVRINRMNQIDIYSDLSSFPKKKLEIL